MAKSLERISDATNDLAGKGDIVVVISGRNVDESAFRKLIGD